MFENLPQEMHQYKQWFGWRLEINLGKDKPSKVPYQIGNGFKASVIEPAHWSSFDKAVNSDFTCVNPCDPTLDVRETGFTGIAFALTIGDPYTFIDCDDTHGDVESYNEQVKLFNMMDTYTEISHSGKGIHMIVKATIPSGRRRHNIEIYNTDRFFALTGNVFQNKFVINERQSLAYDLWESLGGKPVTYHQNSNSPEINTDDEVLTMASQAVNGDKFDKLFRGEWLELNYPSQSEADLAFIDIIQFYTKNFNQIWRCFARSVLGQTPKDNYKHRSDRYKYVEYMINKSFDKELPKLDLDAINIRFTENVKAQIEQEKANALVFKSELDTPVNDYFPPGLVGECAQYIFDNSPTPIKEVAFAGAMGLMSAITGRAYNVSGTGLNQYILLLSSTGTGKEAMSTGVNNILLAAGKGNENVLKFMGPAGVSSGIAIIKQFEVKKSYFIILSEFGLKLQSFGDDVRGDVTKIKTALLELYNKSGKGQLFGGIKYSDKNNDVDRFLAPALTIIAESTQESFYSALSPTLIKNGFLPRFTILEVKTDIPYYKRNHKTLAPPIHLVEQISTLAAICNAREEHNIVQDVQFDRAADDYLYDFSRFCTDTRNVDKNKLTKDLWSRAHMKAMKTAAVVAVGINFMNPVITIDIAKRAVEMVVEEVNNLAEKFDNDEVGEAINGASENVQYKELVNVIRDYRVKPFDYWKKYGVEEAMHRDGVMPISAIQRRLLPHAAYKTDKIGATNALKKQIQSLLDADVVNEVNKKQLKDKYGSNPRSIVVIKPEAFMRQDTGKAR